ncbi:MAG: hypothetical protein ACR2HG_06380 [Pyrinomonadaceae bacterium]
MTDNQFSKLSNALTEPLDSIERVEQIFSEEKRVETDSTSDDYKIKEHRV